MSDATQGDTPQYANEGSDIRTVDSEAAGEAVDSRADIWHPLEFIQRFRNPDDGSTKTEIPLQEPKEIWQDFVNEHPGTHLEKFNTIFDQVLPQVKEFADGTKHPEIAFHDGYHMIAFAMATEAVFFEAIENNNDPFRLKEIAKVYEVSIEGLRDSMILAGITHDLGNIAKGAKFENGQIILDFIKGADGDNKFTAKRAEDRSKKMLPEVMKLFGPTEGNFDRMEMITGKVIDFTVFGTQSLDEPYGAKHFADLIQLIDQFGQAPFNARGFKAVAGLLYESHYEADNPDENPPAVLGGAETFINFLDNRLDQLSNNLHKSLPESYQDSEQTNKLKNDHIRELIITIFMGHKDAKVPDYELIQEVLKEGKLKQTAKELAVHILEYFKSEDNTSQAPAAS